MNSYGSDSMEFMVCLGKKAAMNYINKYKFSAMISVKYKGCVMLNGILLR